MDYAHNGTPPLPMKRARTIQACARCRRQKLKCDGEAPCARCTRLRVVCRHVDEEAATAAASNFHHHNSHPPRMAVDAQLQHALARIAQLEASVGDIQRRMGESDSTLTSFHARGTGGPGGGAGNNDSSSGQANSMLFPAPFTEVAFDKVSLENRQVTRANSPNVAEEDGSNNNEGRPSEPKDARLMNALSIASLVLDPIESGVVDEARGQYLLDFYMTHCYSYLPFFESETPISLRHLQKMDGFLMSAMLAVASRYAESHAQPQSDSSKRESEQLCQLAEAHLGATLVKSRHRLGDVQAVIMLHAWSLRSGGKGSDPWILSGHAFRLAKRLSIDQVSASYRHGGSGSGDEHRAARRTWLLLCASDCFPSLGFGRPASPRENLESCAKIVQELTDLFHIEGIDIGCEAFIACQVQLASISRQLLDWVNDATRRMASKPGMVWERYSSLKQQVDDCDRLWDTPRVGGHEQRRSARLFRLHIKLCLATFALRLSKSAQSAVSTASDLGRSSQYSGSPASVTVAAEQPFERDRHRSYRRASMEAIYDMIIIQSQEPCLAFVPDYLVTALGQAVIAFIGLLEDEVDEEGEGAGGSRSYYHDHAARLVHSALRTLSHFEGSRTGLATFLSSKIRERMERSPLNLTSDPTSKLLAGDYTRQQQHTLKTHASPHYNNSNQRGGCPSMVRQTMPLPLSNMPSQVIPSPTVVTQQTLTHWADPDPQWGDFSQWWDHDDPLRLLFGAGADALNWAPNMQQQQQQQQHQ